MSFLCNKCGSHIFKIIRGEDTIHALSFTQVPKTLHNLIDGDNQLKAECIWCEQQWGPVANLELLKKLMQQNDVLDRRKRKKRED
jgi:hypothetical protein